MEKNNESIDNLMDQLDGKANYVDKINLISKIKELIEQEQENLNHYENLLEEKWLLKAGDKDMIVMQHQFEYELKGAKHKLNSSLVVIGDDEVHTAMAKTVGLPLAITIKNFLTGKFKLYGVQIPLVKEIYEPMLSELESLNIIFSEKEA